jgi:hypothetical protein
LAAAILAAAGNSDATLLHFTATWCGPCQATKPVVAQLAASGYRVQSVDIDQQRDVAQQYRVTSVPTFVFVAGGREVGRVVGGVPYEQLAAKLDELGARQPPAAPRSEPRPALAAAATRRNEPPKRAAGDNTIDTDTLVRSTVRLRVRDARGASNGSGTIIDAHEDQALVLTCAHIFRESGGKGEVLVEQFGAEHRSPARGEVLDFDLTTDVALVAFRPGGRVEARRVAPSGHRIERGDDVNTCGCDHGADPTTRQSEIAAVGKYLGPPNIVVAGAPVEGRSGGGLFTSEGLVIGVCNAADAAGNEGLYAGLASIHAALDRVDSAFVYQARADATKVIFDAPPSLPLRMPLGVVR